MTYAEKVDEICNLSQEGTDFIASVSIADVPCGLIISHREASK
jgi:hypothetical protein